MIKLNENNIESFKEACLIFDWEQSGENQKEQAHNFFYKNKISKSYENNYERLKEILGDILCDFSGTIDLWSYFDSLHRYFYYRANLNNEYQADLFFEVAESIKNFLGQAHQAGMPNELMTKLVELSYYYRVLENDLNKTISDRYFRYQSHIRGIKAIQNKYELRYFFLKEEVKIHEEELIRVTKEISKKMKKFGGLRFLECMKGHLQENSPKGFLEYELLDFSVHASTKGKYIASIPWGYLFKLASTHLHYGSTKKKNFPKVLEEIVEDSRALISTMDIESFGIYNDLFNRGDKFLDYIQDKLLLDSCFKLPQVCPRFTLKILDGLLSWVDSVESQSLNLKLKYSKFRTYIENYVSLGKTNKQANIIIDSNSLTGDLEPNEIGFINNALEKFIRDSHKFISPLDKVDLNPFLYSKNTRHYHYFLRSIQSYALIEFGLEVFRQQRIKNFDGELGIIFEDFVRQALNEKNIDCKSGIYENIKVKNKSYNGDVDIAIEFDDHILLIEVKKKSLTKDARSGNTATGLIDLQKSLLKSYVQALKHTYILKENSEIKFTSGDQKIVSNSKRIEYVSLVLFDYGVLHDKNFISQFFQTIDSSKFTIQKGFEDLEDDMAMLNNLIEEYRFYYNELSMQNTDMTGLNLKFLSLNQFLIILDKCKTKDDFKDRLNKNKHISFGANDWYFEYFEGDSL
ncbi:MAG: hypothetical protein MK033_06800 [Candidatus Caenarcaniphilales bacterium]|nr:hypothetical protein [Candidatus Caenarcaniphilales bacterium]